MDEAPAASARRKIPLERVRAMIRAEVARHHPREVAESTLALIVESALRFPAPEDELAHRVFDGSGEPRPAAVADFERAIADAVTRVRHQHPNLFSPREEGAAVRGPRSEPAATSEAQSTAPPVQAGSPGRDWLHVAPASGATHRTRARSGSASVLARASRTASSVGARLRDVGQGSAAAARRLRPVVAGAGELATRPVRTAFAARPALSAYAVVAGALALALVWAGSTLFVSDSAQPPDRSAAPSAPAFPPASTAEAERPVRSVAQSATTPRPPEPEATGTVAPQATAASAPAPAAIRGVPEVLDTATLRLEGRIVRLFGLEWARGGNAEDLTRYLRAREVACKLATAPDLYRCEVDAKDLSQVILYNGGARARSDAPPELRSAESRARSERLGVWAR